VSEPDRHRMEALMKRMLDLLLYIHLKKSLGIENGGEEDGRNLITFFNDPSKKDQNDKSIILNLTQWDESSFNELLKRFSWNVSSLVDLNKFSRMQQAHELLTKFGLDAATLLRSTRNQNPLESAVISMQDALRAKHDEAGWLGILQSINDKLRVWNRDAMASYVLFKMQKKRPPGFGKVIAGTGPGNLNTLISSDTELRKGRLQPIDTPEKLFEYLLIDPKMDPCMKTSRIKQAISTVQLFIQRWIMDLEAELNPPSAAAVTQWEWMKYYRLWEANMLLYLYPENWLEPELRDSKSSFFKDLEGELLQADITDELAETAFMHYLEKLDEVATLEICSILHEGDEIVHVVSRTPGIARKYYYSKFEHGYWTPLQKIDLDIEGNPVRLVVWRGRLFLYWLKIVVKGKEQESDSTDEGSLMDMKVKEVKKAPRRTIEVNLMWSEYYDNTWHPPKSSDFDDPMRFYTFGSYMRSHIKMGTVVLPPIDGIRDLEVKVSYDPSNFPLKFHLYNTYNSPYHNLFWDNLIPGGVLSNPRRNLAEENGGLVSWGQNVYSEGFVRKVRAFKHRILNRISSTGYRIIDADKEADKELSIKPFKWPFFYQDKKHVFFVCPKEEEEMSISQFKYMYAENGNAPIEAFADSGQTPPPIFTPIRMRPIIAIKDIDADDDDNNNNGSILSAIDINNSNLVTEEIDVAEDLTLDRVLPVKETVAFDNLDIGPLGSLYAADVTRGRFAIKSSPSTEDNI
jgi:hypothetical protein